MKGLRSHQRLIDVVVASCLLFTAADAAALALSPGPVDTSGHLGYNYRTFSVDGGQDDSSHQLLGVVRASTYFGEPWLATSNMSLTVTQDSSDSTASGSTTTADSQIMTGDLGLNVLPQSKTPFNLHLQMSDSRVDRVGTGMTPITFVGEDYSSTLIGLRQSIISNGGDRYRAHLDLRSWESAQSGEYDDQTVGLDADIRRPKQRIVARTSLQTNEYSLASRENETLMLDLNHYYYPLRNFRVDTKASVYEYDRSFLDPSTSDTRLSTNDIMQASSFAFWRPSSKPLSVSGGVRVFSMDGTQAGVATNDQLQMAANIGAFYQANKHLRIDASLSSTIREIAGVEDNVHRQHLGVLYQTDWRQIAGFTHQAYADADADQQSDVLNDFIDIAGAVGHTFGRTWWAREQTTPTSLRLNVNQAVRFLSSGEGAGTTTTTINHSASLAFNQRAWGGNTLAQFTVSDSRKSGDIDFTQQLYNFQLSRDQDLGRRSSITGDITVQYVSYDDSGVESDTTTSTVRAKFQHYRMLGVPRLQFISDLAISQISTEGAIDRQDWSNRLAYSIGKLETSVSYRLTTTDSRDYDLLYFQAMRRF